jgi:hypothetical protein
MLKRVLIDEAVEVLFQCARDFARSTGTGPISQALGPLLGKALHPFAEGRVGKVEQRGDRIDVVTCDDCTDSLRAAKDTGLFRLFEYGL